MISEIWRKKKKGGESKSEWIVHVQGISPAGVAFVQLSASADRRFFSAPPATALSTKLFLTWTNVWNIVERILFDLRFLCHKLFNTGEGEKMERAIRWNLFSWECIWHSVLQIKEPAFSVYGAAHCSPLQSSHQGIVAFCWLNPVLSGTGFHVRCVSGRRC